MIFLVDRSGSMGMVDAIRRDETKWPAACEHLRRLMRSIPDLKQFQVVTFSTDVRFPLGREGEWLDYAPKTSADEVYKTLTATAPKGGTNLYAGLETAFRYRDQGLQAIYLFSDGLPNDGPGLTKADKEAFSQLANKDTRLADQMMGDKLGDHVRLTVRSKWNHGPDRVRIESVGFFYDSSALGSFLWMLSRENGGNFIGMNKP